MRQPQPYCRNSQLKLKWTPYFACLGGVTAAALGVWVPFYPIVLALATVAGTASFALFWRAVRRQREGTLLDPNLPFLLTFAASLLRPPAEAGYTVLVLSGARFFAVWLLTYAGLLALFRNRLRQDLSVGPANKA